MSTFNDQSSALIGHTGFVGGNLATAANWSDLYNSKNIRELATATFDRVICAGVSAVKWQANRDPAADWAAIVPLLDALSTLKAREFTLISTVDVYPNPVLVQELDCPELDKCHAYGRHRLQIEQFVRQRFPDALIVRLPGMFGPGLKKNAIYDLLHNNQIQAIDPAARFQFYDVRWLWADLQVARNAGLKLVNFSTQPLGMGEVAQRVFNRALPDRDGPHGLYDFRSNHAALWGRNDGYLYGKDQVLAALQQWVTTVPHGDR